MPLLYTENADVESRWLGGDTPATSDQLETFLSDAEDEIVRAFPDIEQRLEVEDGLIHRVKRVAARMVIRHLQNPTGTRSTQSATGPFSESTTYAEEHPGALTLTADDRKLLAPQRATGGAFTIRLGSLD